MPRYNATVAMTLKITTEITVRAKDEETATARVHEMIADTRFGTLVWEVKNDTSRSDWNEEEANVVIEDVQED